MSLKNTSTFNIRINASFLGLFAFTAAAAWAQASGSSALVAKFTPGTSMRYELEALVHVESEHTPYVQLNVPSDCSYTVKAVMRLDFISRSTEGAISGNVSFQGVQTAIPECVNTSKARMTDAVNEFVKNGTAFEIYPAGDVRLTRPFESQEPELASILRKAAWDALQPQLTDMAVSAGSAPVSSRKYLYWPDTFLEGMEVAATAMHHARDVQIENANCALLEYKQVFSPTEVEAYVETRSRASDFAGTTVVAGRSSVAVLWEPTAQRMVYLRRKRTIDNRLMLKYVPNDQTDKVGRYLVEEESTLRWLPEENSESWLAALHTFEVSPDQPVAQPVAAARTRGNETREISDVLDRTPRGFEHWGKIFCNGQLCFELSLAVPENTRIADSGNTTVLLLSGSGLQTVTIAVGPIFDLQCCGLTEEELLQQRTERFIRNNLWFARGTGEPLNFSSESLHDRPAGLSEFTSSGRDLKPIRGHVVMVIAPYNRLVPVSCAYDAAQPALDAVCQTVTTSIMVR
jgi:hypothetical protein